MLGLSQSRGLKLFGREISFQEFQPICCWYINVTDRQTDRQTDGRLTVASPRSALASRGKNWNNSDSNSNSSSLLCVTVVLMLCVFKFAVFGWVHYFHHYLHQGVTVLATVWRISSVICWNILLHIVTVAWLSGQILLNSTISLLPSETSVVVIWITDCFLLVYSVPAAGILSPQLACWQMPSNYSELKGGSNRSLPA